MTEIKTHNKMYKSGKFWLVAGVALTSAGIQTATHEVRASADDVPNTSKVTSSANIPVDHSTINNSVNAATNAGVKVTQDATTNANVNTKDSASAKQAAQQNEASQASDIDKVTAQQNANTQAFKDTTNQVNQTNSDAQNKLSNANNQVNTAANNATSNGVNVTTNSQNVTPDYNEVDNTNDKTLRNSVQSNVDKTNDAVATATQDAQNQTNNINQVTDKYVADKKQLADEKAQVTQQQGSYQDIINQARAAGITINDHGTVDNQNFQDTMNQYAQKQQSLQQAITDYNNAKAQLANEQNNIANSTAARNAALQKAQSAGVTVEQSKAVSTDDYNAAKSDLDNQTNAINQAVDNYVAEKAKVDQENADNQAQYQKDLDAYKEKLAENVGKPGSTDAEVIQQLFLGAEDHSNVTVDASKSSSGIGWYTKRLDNGYAQSFNPDTATKTAQPETFNDNNNLGWPLDSSNAASGNNAHGTKTPWAAAQVSQGQTLTVDYTNLTDSSYAGQNISKIERTFTFTTVTSPTITFAISKDPSMGFWYFHSMADGGQPASDGLYHTQVDVSDKFFDAAGNQITIGDHAYISNGSLNNFANQADATTQAKYANYPGYKAEESSVQNATFMQIIGSTVVNHADGYAYSDYANDPGLLNHNTGTTLPVWDNSANSNRYLGAALYKLNPGQTSVNYSSRNANSDVPFVWFTSDTANLPVSTPPTPPTLIQYPTFAKVTQHDVNYTRTVSASADVQNINYNRQVPVPTVQATNYTINDEPASVKPADLSTNYHLNQVTAIPYAPVKSADVDDFDAAGKSVTKGDTIHFTLKSSDMAADRGDDVTSSVRTDQLDDNLTYSGYKAYWTAPDGTTTDVTNLINLKQDGQHLVFTDSNELLAKYNATKSQQTQFATIVLSAVANTDGASMTNVFNHSINGQTDTSNTIAKITTIDFHPHKETVDNLGYDSNGRVIEQGDAMHYIVKMDLSQFTPNTLVSKDQATKGLSLTDSYSPNFVPDKTTAYVMVNGQNVTNQFTFNWDDTNHRVTAQVNDPQAFLKQYNGSNPELHLFGQASQTAEGVIVNTAFQNDFGDTHQTETVQNTVVKVVPQKSLVDIVGSHTQYSDIAMNADFVYALQSSTRPANSGQTTTSWTITDNFDTNHDLYQGSTPVMATQDFTDEAGNVIKAGTDISQYFDITYDGHKLTVIAKPSYLALINTEKNRETAQGWVAYANMRRIAAGTAVNTLDEFYNNRVTDSNTVTSKTSDGFTPHKETVDDLGHDSNGKVLEQGDNVHYIINWDNTDLTKGELIPAAQKQAGLSITDNFSQYFQPSSTKVTANGVDVTDEFTTTINGNQLVVAPKNIDDYIAKYAGQSLQIHMMGKLSDDAQGNIKNTAIQNEFGENRDTETVVNTVQIVKPSKSLTDKANTNDSFDKVALNSEFNYKLDSSDRPANIGQGTTSWSIQDKFDTTHDDYQGLTPVYATHDFVDANGQTVTAGTDISHYFTTSYNAGTLLVSATQDYLNVINSDVNRKNAQGWAAYPVMKRIATGTANNTLVETYNNRSTTSNTVTSTTVDGFTPHKEGVDSNDVDNNGKTIERGDLMHYKVTWDNSDLTPDTVISDDLKAKGLSLTDNFDAKFAPSQDQLSIMNGSTNITSEFNITWSGNSVTATPKDINDYIQKYSGTKLILNLIGNAKQDAEGDIKNTAVQNEFGENRNTETVVNNIQVVTPSKALADATNNGTYDKVALNSDFTYKLSSSTRPANIGQTTTGWSISDNFDTSHDLYQGTTPVYATTDFVDANGNTVKAGTEISQYFNVAYNNGQLSVTANADWLKLMNSDANRKTAQGWVAYPLMKRIATGTANNTLSETYNNRQTSSNTVTSTTVDNFQPHKEGVDGNGYDNNGKNIERGDLMHYKITWDNTDLTKDTEISDNLKAKGLSLTDNFDAKFAPNQSQLSIMNGNDDITSEFNITWSGNSFTATPKDINSYIQKYAGTKLLVNLVGNAKQDAEGEVQNTAVQNEFGENRNTETILNYVMVSNPTKALTDKAGGTTTFDKVAKNAEFAYNLSSSVRPGNLGQTTKNWSISDNFDTAHDAYQNATPVYATRDFMDANGQVVKAGTDISSYFDVSYDNGKLTVSAKQAYLDIINSDANRKVEMGWAAYPLMKRIADGTATNTLTETYNNRSTSSNTVTSTTKDDFTPHKDVVDDNGKSDNGKTIEEGDSIHYQITWDNTDLSKDTLISDDLKAKGLSMTDNFSSQFVPSKDQLSVVTADGQNVTSDFDIAWGDNTVTIKPKDINSYIQKYAGTKLTINLLGQATQDADGEIPNTATQNEFGETRNSETVVNYVHKNLNPVKGIVLDGNNDQNIDNIAIGTQFSYSLSSHIRPANLGEQTKQWSISDKFDTEHDAYTGVTTVKATRDFVDADGNTVKAGTDITKYFDITYADGELTVTAKKDFLDIMNSDANMKTEQGWEAYPVMKRIAAGDVYNTMTEKYNNRTIQSNTVKSHTNEPAKPVETPKVETPTPVVQPVSTPAPVTPAPVVATPAPTPHTGKEAQSTNVWAVMLTGLIATFGLFGFKKKQKD